MEENYEIDYYTHTCSDYGAFNYRLREGRKKPSESSGKPSSSVQTEQSAPEVAENFDTTTVEGYLNTFGFTTEDVECYAFTRADALSHDASGNVTSVGVFTYDYLGTDIYTWLEKFLKDLEAVSDDGVVKNSGKLKSGNEQWTEEFVTNKENGWDADKNRMILDGEYLYKGKKVGIYLECYTFVASSSNQGDSKPRAV